MGLQVVNQCDQVIDEVCLLTESGQRAFGKDYKLHFLRRSFIEELDEPLHDLLLRALEVDCSNLRGRDCDLSRHVVRSKVEG